MFKGTGTVDSWNGSCGNLVSISDNEFSHSEDNSTSSTGWRQSSWDKGSSSNGNSRANDNNRYGNNQALIPSIPTHPGKTMTIIIASCMAYSSSSK